MCVSFICYRNIWWTIQSIPRKNNILYKKNFTWRLPFQWWLSPRTRKKRNGIGIHFQSMLWTLAERFWNCFIQYKNWSPWRRRSYLQLSWIFIHFTRIQFFYKRLCYQNLFCVVLFLCCGLLLICSCVVISGYVIVAHVVFGVVISCKIMDRWWIWRCVFKFIAVSFLLCDWSKLVSWYIILPCDWLLPIEAPSTTHRYTCSDIK